MPGAARIGDPFSCGDFVAQGSPNVMVNNIPLTRHGDATTGHGCWPPTTVNSVASTVLANNILVGLKGITNNVPHCCPDVGCHSGNITVASTNVKIED